jgi:very-short-patch-repair endonuclease
MNRERLHSKPELKYVRRHLRREQTPAERFLWQKLRNRQLYGRKFKRQHSIGLYVVDFYCAEERLANRIGWHCTRRLFPNL